MLQKFEVSGVHTSIDKALNKYVARKIGGLDRYMPRKSRDSAHAEVFLKEETKGRDNNKFQCEVTMYLPHKNIVVKENAHTFYEAIDIVESKLKIQLKKYKDMSPGGKRKRHLMARFSRKGSTQEI
jgi:ribosomal subunit interface protein